MIAFTRCADHMRSIIIGPAIFVLTVGLTVQDGVVGKPTCPAGHFRNFSASSASSASDGCSPCSTCPINHIVRKPCNRQNDTVCGPFYEFEFFNQRQNQIPGQGTGNQQLRVAGIGGEVLGGGKRGDHEENPDGLGSHPDRHLTPSNSAESSDSARCCNHPEWRVVCFGLISAVVIIISLVLAGFALVSFCRNGAKSTKLMSETTGTEGTTGFSSSAASAIVVNRDVRHLEEQLMHNQRRKAFLRWLFGSSTAADRLFSSNDYLDERHRRRFMIHLLGEAIPLQPYPGMISTVNHEETPLGTGSEQSVVADIRNARNRGQDDSENPSNNPNHSFSQALSRSDSEADVHVDDVSDQGTSEEHLRLLPETSCS